MPTYTYECPTCGEYDVEQRITEDALTTCQCGAPIKRIITSCSVIIPTYMRAPGSSGSSADSCDRQARYLQSEQHRRDREQSERIYERSRRAQEGIKEHLETKLSDPAHISATRERVQREKAKAA